MNNDAWKAAVTPAYAPASDIATPTATAAIYSSEVCETPAPPPNDFSTTGSRIGKAASRAARAAKAAEKAARAANKAVAKAAVATDCSDGAETAPASPGSPAATTPSTMTAVSLDDPPASITTVAPTVAALQHAAADSAVHESKRGSGVPAAPWDIVEGVIAERGDGERDGGDEAVDEPLSASLDLEPDLELEPGVDLKADLGLPVVNSTAVGPMVSDTATCFEPNEASIEEPAGTVVSDPTSATATAAASAGRSDDLGFELIEKAEAVGAAVAATVGKADSLGTTDGSNGSGGKARKGWSWAWSRS